MKIDEFMTTRIESIDANSSVYDAIEKMVDRRIRSLLVVFSEKAKDHGVITARDIVFKVLSKKSDPKSVKVASIASKPIVCIDRTKTIHDAAALMEESVIARIFVCEEGKIVGVLSLLDVMAASLILKARGNYVP
ncbi:MAG: CBS domain-containing protein [Syntrophobacterales bacterium]|jgi:signal-transduction protein with cAMP-binding, CBS, and nucleotidyltransferase domain